MENSMGFPNLNVDEESASVPLGTEREYMHATYGLLKLRYGKYDADAVAAGAAGTVVYHHGNKKEEVTDDVTESQSGEVNSVAGVLICTRTKGYYGWYLFDGNWPDVKKAAGNDSWVYGDIAIGGGDGTCVHVDKGTAPTNKILGVLTSSISDDPNDTVDLYVHCY